MHTMPGKLKGHKSQHYFFFFTPLFSSSSFQGLLFPQKALFQDCVFCRWMAILFPRVSFSIFKYFQVSSCILKYPHVSSCIHRYLIFWFRFNVSSIYFMSRLRFISQQKYTYELFPFPTMLYLRIQIICYFKTLYTYTNTDSSTDTRQYKATRRKGRKLVQVYKP